ncbi:MAG: hypothetical protein AAB569_03300, partial [Patescibacteria group bacterium]
PDSVGRERGLISLGRVGVKLGGRLRYTFVSADRLREAEMPERLARALWCLKVWPADRMASWLAGSVGCPAD